MATPSFPLHAAIKAKDWGRLRSLVTRRVEGGQSIDINEKDASGLTALVMACSANEFEMACILIENGVDVNIPDKNGMTPLMYACYVGNGNAELALLLIEKGADVNMARTDGGWTALMHASQKGYVELVRLLIEKGGVVNTRATNGCTALYWTCGAGHVEVVRYLIDKGAAINLAQTDGFNPFMSACSSGHVEVARYLIEKDVDINLAVIANGFTALMYACQSGRAAVVTLLMENEAHFSMQNKEGKTALDLAKASNKSDCVTILETFLKESNEKRRARSLALAAEREQRVRDRERERERERELSEGETKQSSSSPPPDSFSSQQQPSPPSQVEDGGVNQTYGSSNVGPSVDPPNPPLPSSSSNISLIDFMTELREEMRALQKETSMVKDMHRITFTLLARESIKHDAVDSATNLRFKEIKAANQETQLKMNELQSTNQQTINELKDESVSKTTLLAMEARLRSEIQELSVVKDREIADLKRLLREKEEALRAARRDGGIAENL